MKVDYDKKADALYIKIKTMPIKRTMVLRDNILLDLDANEKIVGIEILEANKRLISPQKSTRQVVRR